MNDMNPVIVPKSDQINADDLLAGPMTITINNVKIAGGKEQPVSMFFNGSDKAYRPCKSMCRVIVSAWGADASKYVGRSMTLYCDPKVKWAGLEVGGIRISHMSHIDSAMTMALTVTRANKKPFTVRPLPSGAQESAAAQVSTAVPGLAPSQEDAGQGEVATAADTVLTAEQAVLNINNATDPESLSLAAELARAACKTAPEKMKASEAYRKRLAELKAQS